MGMLLSFTRDPFLWGTGTVTALFMILLGKKVREKKGRKKGPFFFY